MVITKTMETDIQKFLRHMLDRLDSGEANPEFKPVYGRMVIGWLQYAASHPNECGMAWHPDR